MVVVVVVAAILLLVVERDRLVARLLHWYQSLQPPFRMVWAARMVTYL